MLTIFTDDDRPKAPFVRKVDMLLAAEKTLGLLRAMASSNAETYDCNGQRVCFYCGCYPGYESPHMPDCPYFAALAHLKELEGA